MKQEEADWSHTGWWKRNPKDVIEMARYPLAVEPTAAEFLAALHGCLTWHADGKT